MRSLLVIAEISLALVLSLPHDLPNIGLFEFVTYGVVLVTLVGQGIAMRAILPGWSARHEPIEMALEMPTMSQSPDAPDAPDAPEESPG